MKIIRNVETEKTQQTKCCLEENDRIELLNVNAAIIRSDAIYLHCKEKLIIIDIPESTQITIVSDK